MRNLTEFGAFVQITDEIDGLIHVSDMSWTKRVKHPGDVLKKGDDVRARITNIDVENQRVSLSIKEFLPNEWDSFATENSVGDTVTGRVVNVTDFGLFVDIYEGLEGLAHVSEIETAGDGLEDQFKLGDWVSARILRIEEDDKKVGLTMRGVPQPTEEERNELEAAHRETIEVAAEAEQALSEEEYEAARLAALAAEAAGAESVVEEVAKAEAEETEGDPPAEAAVEVAEDEEPVDEVAEEAAPEAEEVEETPAAEEVVEEAAPEAEEVEETPAAEEEESDEQAEEPKEK